MTLTHWPHHTLIIVFVAATAASCAGEEEWIEEQIQGLGTVTGFTLINADSNQPITGLDPISAGATIDLAALPTRHLNVRANLSATAGSVRFGYDGNTNHRTENSAPFALAGDSNTDYYAWTPSAGSHTIRATPYSGAGATGTAGVPLSLAIAVKDGTSAPPSFTGRIAVSADGNAHDKDDWAATALTLAILAKKDLQSKLVHYDYSDHIWFSQSGMDTQQRTSAVGGAERFGFNTAVFFDDMTQLSAAVANLKNAINASSSTNPLVFILAGPMEVPYRGMAAADPTKRQYVRCVSHGLWNDLHTEGDGHTYDQLIALGCRREHIRDQNGGLGLQTTSNWSWLRNGGTNLTWVYDRIALTRGDASDAGMAYYVLTGDASGTTSKLRTFFGL
jgi:hypothetical protein